MEQIRLQKIRCQVVQAHIDGDRVLGEIPGPVLDKFSPDEMLELWAQAQQETAEANAQLKAATRPRRKRGT